MSSRISRLLWPGLIFVFLGANVCVVGITVYAANRADGGATEPDYYRKAINWDKSAAERDQSAALGWKATISTSLNAATLTLTDREGAPVEGAKVQAEFFAVLDSGSRVTTELQPTDGGTYQYSGILPPGTCEFRVRATRGNDVFVKTLRTTPGTP
jgi:nitrogen fixation protein FixH